MEGRTLKAKQLKDLKATEKILMSATSDITSGLNTINDLCMNKIFPACGNFLLEFQRGMMPGAKPKTSSFDVPQIAQITLFPLRDELDTLTLKLNNLRLAISALIRGEKK